MSAFKQCGLHNKITVYLMFFLQFNDNFNKL